jgi:hypothetical protein
MSLLKSVNKPTGSCAASRFFTLIVFGHGVFLGRRLVVFDTQKSGRPKSNRRFRTMVGTVPFINLKFDLN